MLVLNDGTFLDFLHLITEGRMSITCDAFYIEDDYLIKGTFQTMNESTTLKPDVQLWNNGFWFLPDQCQFRGVECENLKPVLSKDDIYAYHPMSATWLFLSDYFNDELKPDHEKSMEKELTKQDNMKFRVRYKGAAGNRAYFEKHIIGDGSNDNDGWEDSTLEEADRKSVV